MEKHEFTAYHKYLVANSKTREILAMRIMYDCSRKNIQALGLLAKTGDTQYNKDTFYKAADLLINAK